MCKWKLTLLKCFKQNFEIFWNIFFCNLKYDKKSLNYIDFYY